MSFINLSLIIYNKRVQVKIKCPMFQKLAKFLMEVLGDETDWICPTVPSWLLLYVKLQLDWQYEEIPASGRNPNNRRLLLYAVTCDFEVNPIDWGVGFARVIRVEGSLTPHRGGDWMCERSREQFWCFPCHPNPSFHSHMADALRLAWGWYLFLQRRCIRAWTCMCVYVLMQSAPVAVRGLEAEAASCCWAGCPPDPDPLLFPCSSLPL